MNYIFEIIPSLLDGTEMTLSIFVLTLVFFIAVGLDLRTRKMLKI